jgi:required for meiotic nuclear division protein 1
VARPDALSAAPIPGDRALAYIVLVDSSAPISTVALAVPRPRFLAQRTSQVRALLLGQRIAPGPVEGFHKLSDKPLVLAGHTQGCALVFRYGAVVFFGMTPEDERLLCESLTIREPAARPESELVELRIDGDFDAEPRIENSIIFVPDDDIQHLELIGEALAKSVVLAYHEAAIASLFDRIEPLAQNLYDNLNHRERERELLEYIGGALLSEQRMVGRVEVREKPELLWENATLERFYQRLEREYELRDRATSVERKLGLISRTAQTALDLLEQRSTRRVEWYIVVLIVVEILLTVYNMLR